jgi:aspartate-semialdehyde dehydrogenase
VSKQFSPHAIQAGCMIVDNTSAFRMDPKIPLVIPEINGGDIEKYKSQIIANPNCSAIIMLMAVAPLHQVSPVKRIVVSTYQSTSGAGGNAMRELCTQTEEFLERVKAQKKGDILEAIEFSAKEIQKGKALKREAFMHQIAFNLFSHNTAVAANGYNEEENKIVEESRKILHAPNLAICPTCIRVPVFRAHAESILIEFGKKMSADEARKILQKSPGVKVVDDREKNLFPMPFDASGGDDVLVGRIREDLSNPNALVLFVAGDQLRKGAALNAVQIAEKLIA